MKKNIIIGISICIFSIVTFYIIKSFSQTNNGNINPYFAVNLQIYKIFNPELIENNSIEDIREHLNRGFTNFSKKPIPFFDIKNITIEIDSKRIPVRIYTPEDNDDNFPIIIYSHGGSWISGNLDTHDNVCRKLSKNTEAIVISVDYSLAPENPFPLGLNDVYSILEWTYRNSEYINGDKNHIAVVGDSAGGNISAATSLMAVNKNGPHLDCQVLIYPSTNLSNLNTNSWSYFENKFNVSKESMEKYISLYVPKQEDKKNPYVSPLLASDFTKLPDTLVINSEIDPLRDEGYEYAEKLRESGVQVEVKRYEGVTHGFITMDKITNKADDAINEICFYMKNEFTK